MKLRADQVTAIRLPGSKFVNGPTGSGKSAVGVHIMRNWWSQGHNIILVAPPKVLKLVWPGEMRKWDAPHLLMNVVDMKKMSPHDRALRMDAMASGGPQKLLFFTPDIMVNHASQILRLLKHSNTCVLYDEIGMFKQAGTSRVRAARRFPQHAKDIVGMTATAVADDYAALYAQFLCIDGGATFGGSQQNFLSTYFEPPPPYREHAPWTVKRDGPRMLAAAIRPKTCLLEDRKGELPKLVYTPVTFELTPRTREAYEDMTAYGLLLDKNGDEIAMAANPGVQYSLMRQLTSGVIYKDEGYLEFSHERIDITVGLVDCVLKHPSDRVIVTYELRADRDRFIELAKEAPGFPPITTFDTPHWKDAWQARGGVLLMHPKSGGHGLQLEQMCHKVIWMALPWSRDAFDQLIGRVWRFGQTHEVQCYMVSAVDTVDDYVYTRLENKAEYEKLLRQHINSIREAADNVRREPLPA